MIYRKLMNSIHSKFYQMFILMLVRVWLDIELIKPRYAFGGNLHRKSTRAKILFSLNYLFQFI